MPGPVSDSYDPEFGTVAEAAEVQEAMEAVINKIDGIMGTTLHPIWHVIRQDGYEGEVPIKFTEKEVRLIRFGLLRAAADI